MTEPDHAALQFLHLSDIHCTDRFGDGIFDLDADLRRAINDDSADLRKHLGDFTGILVTGDIAYAATAEDYQKADDWLDGLREIAGSPADRTYVVPGNHDVDRTVTSVPAVAAFHNELRTCPLNDVDSRLREWLSASNPDKEIPYRALAAFNAFAERYGCSVSPQNPFWETTLPLPHGFILGIHGITSVFCSNSSDDTGNNKLVVGQAQTLIPISQGRANLSLCHHPPDWLRDADTFQQNMLASTHVQLYGHKHTYRLNQIDESVVVSAGAAHPERGDTWEPRYNAIRLTIEGTNGAFFLVVTVYPRVFKAATRRMQPDYNQTGEDYREFRIELLPPPGHTPSATQRGPVARPPEHSAERATGSQLDEGNPMHPLRRLGYLLAELPPHRRRSIAREFQIEDESETATNAAFLIQRARETDQLKALWDAAAEHMSDDTPNPFRGTVPNDQSC